MAQRKRRRRTVTVREMGVNDIAGVYRLGHRLFSTQEASTFYRTWDAYEVTNNFNQDPHLSLVAESPKATLLDSPWEQPTRRNPADGNGM